MRMWGRSRPDGGLNKRNKIRRYSRNIQEAKQQQSWWKAQKTETSDSRKAHYRDRLCKVKTKHRKVRSAKQRPGRKKAERQQVKQSRIRFEADRCKDTTKICRNHQQISGINKANTGSKQSENRLETKQIYREETTWIQKETKSIPGRTSVNTGQKQIKRREETTQIQRRKNNYRE